MTLGSCCNTGVKHEGTPTGEFVTINGERVYQALPKGDYDKTKAVLFCTDVFGNSLPNGQLVADAFAAEGFATYAVDYLNGDELPEDALNRKDFDFMAWLSKHGKDDTIPHLHNAIKGLKEQGVKDFAATGYCFGGRYVVDLVEEGALKVAIVNHPSLLNADEDLPKIKAKSVPFLWNTCENDQMWPKECQDKAEEVFKGDKNYRRTYWAGASHGFAIRGDPKDETARKAKEGAFEASIKILKEEF